MIELRPAVTDEDLDIWASVKSAVVPNEPVTAAQMRATDEEGRLLLLAERDGVLAGCGIAALSHFEGRGFIAPRVLPEHRGLGVGTTLLRALADHVRALGRTGAIAFVYANDAPSMAFAEQNGLSEVDYQLEQKRLICDEQPPEIPEGIELVPLVGRREELLAEVWPVAREGYADLPLPGNVTFEIDEWLREEGTRPGGSFVAFEREVPVGYAGLVEHANGDATAEHGLTVVRRDRRRRGIARALKQAQLHWAARNDVYELVTWTQTGNEAMQTLNRSLGYVDMSKVITYQGPLP